MEKTSEVIQPILINLENKITEYNSHAVSEIVAHLGVDHGTIVRPSSIDYKGTPNEVLVDITQNVGGDTYMCVVGADVYQDESVFASAGIELKYQDYQLPEYTQFNSKEFIPRLSIIDLLMNLGWAKTRELFFAR